MVHSLPIERVRRIGRALEAALADVARETSGHTSHFYFDADVVIGACFVLDEVRKDYLRAMSTTMPAGVQTVNPSAWLSWALDSWDPHDRLPSFFRTIWSAGFACRARMLYSHILELDNATRSRRTSHDMRAQSMAAISVSKERLEHLLNHDPERTPHDVAIDRLLLEAAHALTFQHLVILEAAAHTSLEDRFEYLGNVLDLESDTGPSIETLLDAHAPEAWRLASAIGLATRHNSGSWLASMNYRIRPRRRRNELADALALLGMRSLLRDVRGQSAQVTLRFYTHTRSLSKACASASWLKNELMDTASVVDDGILAAGLDDNPNTIVRTSDYMLLRSVLPAIAFQNALRPYANQKISQWDRHALSDVVATLKRCYTRARNMSESDVALDDVSLQIVLLVYRITTNDTFARVWFDLQAPLVAKCAHAIRGISTLTKAIADNPNRSRLILKAESRMIDEQIRVFERRTAALAEVEDALVRRTQSLQRDDSLLVNSGIGRWLSWLADTESRTDVLDVIVTAFGPHSTDPFANAIGVAADRFGDDAWLQRYLPAVIACASGQLFGTIELLRCLPDGITPERRISTELLLLRARIGLKERRSHTLRDLRRVTDVLLNDACEVQTGQLARARICAAWNAFYWLHGLSPIERPEDYADIVYVNQIAGRLITSALPGIAPVWYDIILPASLVRLLQSYPGHECVGIATNIRLGPMEEPSRYWKDADIYASWVADHRINQLHGLPYTALLERCARDVALLERASAVSTEDYWADHLLYIRQVVDKRRMSPHE